ncbi:hypothetical protein PRZ48_002644 [Zasmidium cellare]|uniref:C3H1-type domain-containing protein n=1 Tax=Zasmidium cellare TaxID=395010 RepID=A0ABR0EV12_ZASCE|nr:hypothetical protein PRZ48_002644 [Zasmidium cellare]
MDRERPANRKPSVAENSKQVKETPTTRLSQNVSDEIRATSLRIKRHVDELSQGKADTDPEIIKLNRQERNYNAVALSLAKAIEETKVKASPQQAPAGEKVKPEGKYEKPLVKRPSLTAEKDVTPLRRRTASEVCDAAYDTARPSAGNEKRPDQDKTSGGKPAAATPFSSKEKQKETSTKAAPSTRQPKLADSAAQRYANKYSTLMPAKRSGKGLFAPVVSVPKGSQNWASTKVAPSVQQFGSAYTPNQRTTDKHRKLNQAEISKGEPCAPVVPSMMGARASTTLAPSVVLAEAAQQTLAKPRMQMPTSDPSSANKDKKLKPEKPSGLKPTAPVPPVGKKEQDQDSKMVAPSIEPDQAAPQPLGKPRIQVPPFVINPDRKAPEKMGPDLYYNDKDFGAGCREQFKRPPPEGEGGIETQSLVKHEWKVSMVADLPKKMGYEDEEEGAEMGEGNKSGTHPQDDELEDYVDEAETPVKTEKGPMKPELEIAAFGWNGFQIKGKGASSRMNAFRDDGDEGHEKFKRLKAQPSDLERRDSLMTPDDAQHLPTDKTFSMNEALPQFGRNVRGRFFNPRDPRRDDLSNTSLRDIFRLSRQAPKRRRSSSPDAMSSSRRPVCRSCWRRGSWCTSDGNCKACNDGNRVCEYIWCGFGLNCRSSRCVYMHPGQDEGEGEWNVVHGDLGQKNSWR